MPPHITFSTSGLFRKLSRIPRSRILGSSGVTGRSGPHRSPGVTGPSRITVAAAAATVAAAVITSAVATGAPAEPHAFTGSIVTTAARGSGQSAVSASFLAMAAGQPNHTAREVFASATGAPYGPRWPLTAGPNTDGLATVPRQAAEQQTGTGSGDPGTGPGKAGFGHGKAGRGHGDVGRGPGKPGAGHGKAPVGHGKAGAGHGKAKASHHKPRHGRKGYTKAAARARKAGHHSARKKARHSKPWHSVRGVDSMMGVSAASLRHAGLRFEARYIAPGSSKSLTRGELASLERHHIRVVAVWENGALDMLGGWAAGRWAAKQAQRGLRHLGIPNAPIYFCADFDAAEYQQRAINNYLRGVASVVGHRRTGLYGGYWVVKRAFNAHVIRYGWQTYAWSGGHWDHRAALRQYSVNQSHAGVPVDFDLAVHRNYGAAPPRHR